MRRLANITKPSHYFYAIDGSVIRTSHELFSFLSNCDESSYQYHANDERNDFAEWVKNVLLLTELADSLSKTTSLAESRKLLLESFEKSEAIELPLTSDNVFHTVDDYGLKNVCELFYYLNNCEDWCYWHHVRPDANDFASWVRDIWDLAELEQELRQAQNREQSAEIVKQFIIGNTEGMALSVMAVPSKNPDAVIKEAQSDFLKEPTITANKAHSGQQPTLFFKAAEEIAPEKRGSDTTDGNNTDKKDQKKRNVEEKIDLKSNILNLEREEEEVQEKIPNIDARQFKEFTDDELEHFVKFSHHDKIDDADLKVEYLKSALAELENMIKELRRAEREPLVAELLVRVLEAKIKFYALSKSVDDYNRIIQGMKDVQKEIQYYADKKTTNFADEVRRGLELQGITMKKEFLGEQK